MIDKKNQVDCQPARKTVKDSGKYIMTLAEKLRNEGKKGLSEGKNRGLIS
jgi:hypothetical protein